MVKTSEIIGKTLNPIMLFISISSMNNDLARQLLFDETSKTGINANNSKFMFCDDTIPVENIIAEIETSDPIMIVTLGGSSFEKLMPNEKFRMTRDCGKIYKYSDYHLIIPNFHPNYVLQNPTIENKEKFKETILFALKVAGNILTDKVNNKGIIDIDRYLKIGSGLQSNKAETEIIENYEQFVKFCDEYVEPYEEIGYDVETNALPVMDENHRIVGFSLASGKAKGCYVPLKALDFEIPDDDKEKIKKKLEEILEKKEIWVFNCMHEIPVTWNWTGYFMDKVKDLYAIAKLMNCGKHNERGSMGLKNLCKINLNLEDWSEDLDIYFELFKELDDPKKDNKVKLKAMMSKYYVDDELENIMKMIEDKHDELKTEGKLNVPVLSYEYVPYKLIGRYGSLDSSNMFALRDFYYKQMDNENKIFKNIDIYKGFDLWMKHHIAGATLEMNGAYWNDKKASDLGNWCTSTMKQNMKNLIVHPLSKDLLKNKLMYDFSLMLMQNFVTEIVKSDFTPARVYKDSIALNLTGENSENIIMKIMEIRRKENEDREERNQANARKLGRKLKITEIEKPVSIPEIKEGKNGNKTVKLDTECFYILAELQGIFDKYPNLFDNWFNGKMREISSKDMSISEMKELMNITSTSKDFRDYVSKILITQDVKLAHFLCALSQWLDDPKFEPWMIKDEDSVFINGVKEIMSMSEDFYDPEKLKAFKKLFKQTKTFVSMKLVNLLRKSLTYSLERLDSGAIEELYNYYGMMEMDINDNSTWTKEYEWMFNYKVFKKLSKVYTTYVYGNSTGRGNVCYVNKDELQSGETFCKRKANYNDDYEEKHSKGYDTILNSGFFVNGAKTGRWQSGLHNISNGDPKNIYTSRFPGGTIMMPDYSGVEIKTIAAISGDETLLGAIRDGLDVHTLTASLIYKVPMEEVQKRQRALAKNATFHILYGGSTRSFANSYCKGDMEQAEEIIEGYFKAYPRIKEFINRAHEQCTKYDRVTTRTNRTIYVEKRMREGKEDVNGRLREAQNFPIQGSAEDCAGGTLYDICTFLAKYPKWIREGNAKEARNLIRDPELERRMINFLKANPRETFRTKPFCFIHDSIENDVYPDEVFLMFNLLDYLFNVKSSEDWDVPFSSDVTIGPSMGQEIEVEDIEYSDDYNEATFVLKGYIDDIEELINNWKTVYKTVEMEKLKDEEGNEKQDDEEKISWGLMMSRIKAPIKSTFGKTLLKGKRKLHVIIK